MPFPLAKNVLEPLATMASASAIDDAIQRKMRGRDVERIEKGTRLAISNEDIIRIIKSLENSGILIDRVTIKHDIKA